MQLDAPVLYVTCSDGSDGNLGSVIFTAAADDAFSQQYERNRRICTSGHEQQLVDRGSLHTSDTHDVALSFPAEPHVSSTGPTSTIAQRASSQQYQVSSLQHTTWSTTGACSGTCTVK